MNALDPILASAIYALSEALTTLARQTRRGDAEQADAVLRALRALLTLALRLGADAAGEPLPGRVSAAESLPVLLDWISTGLAEHTARPGCLLGEPWAELRGACGELVAIDVERSGAALRAA